jgi:hypothetical protein
MVGAAQVELAGKGLDPPHADVSDQKGRRRVVAERDHALRLPPHWHFNGQLFRFQHLRVFDEVFKPHAKRLVEEGKPRSAYLKSSARTRTVYQARARQRQIFSSTPTLLAGERPLEGRRGRSSP